MKTHAKWLAAVGFLALVSVFSLAAFRTHTAADSAINCQSSDVTVPADALNVKSYGAKGDGVTDDGTTIQTAITDAANKNLPLYFPAGTYMVKANTLQAKNNSQLYLDNNATIQAFPNGLTSYAVLNINNVSNVGIAGGTIAGERDGHTGTGGEWGFVISVSGGSNIVIKGTTLRDGWGDGLYITHQTNSLTACYDIMTNNRRNNISVIDGSGITLDHLTLSNAHGTAPQAGIDFEPNAGNSINGAILKNSTVSDNTGSGVTSYGGVGSIQNLTIQNNTVTSSGMYGILVEYASNVTVEGNTVTNSDLNNNANYYDIFATNSGPISIVSNTINTSNAKYPIAVGTAITNGTISDNCLTATAVLSLPSTIISANNGTCQSAPSELATGGPSQDATPPIIILNGSNPVVIHVGDTFTDPGVTATDNIDGNISGQVVATSAVNTAVAGSYIVTYQVSDSAGNRASTSRTVVVKSSEPGTVVAATPVIPPADVAPAPSAPAVASGFWSFIPFVKNIAPKAATIVTPTLPAIRTQPITHTTQAGKKNYDIVKVTDTLNGVVVHVSTVIPDNWQLDTSTMADGTYTLVSTLQYADGTTDSSSQVFTVDNTPTIFQRLIAFIERLFKK